MRIAFKRVPRKLSLHQPISSQFSWLHKSVMVASFTNFLLSFHFPDTVIGNVVQRLVNFTLSQAMIHFLKAAASGTPFY